MTPTAILAAAVAAPVGSFLPVRLEWLKGWIGPAFRPYSDNSGGEDMVILEVDGRWIVAIDEHRDIDRYSADELRLDTRLPSVRDHLIRCGVAPTWARDNPAACWAAGMGTSLRCSLGVWKGTPGDCEFREVVGGSKLGQPVIHHRDVIGKDGKILIHAGWRGGLDYRPASGPETGAAGKALVDLAALRADCLLGEATGWFVPLVGGGVGFFPMERADGFGPSWSVAPSPETPDV